MPRSRVLGCDFARAAAFRWCCIECGASIFGVLNEQSCKGRDDPAIKPVSQRLIASSGDGLGQLVGEVAQPIHEHFWVHGAGGCECLSFGDSDERNIVVVADLHGDTLFDQIRVGQLTGEIVQGTQANFIAGADQ
jgi:hypothetical protein